MKNVLVTGAGGELGTALVRTLLERNAEKVVALDREFKRPWELPRTTCVRGDICDREILRTLSERHSFTHVFHLAAILSTSGEKNPLLAHRVNVDGSINVLEHARLQSVKSGEPVVFVFPSTIAVYGLPDDGKKESRPPVKENEFLDPITMYGLNKRYVEQLGVYFANHFSQLTESNTGIVDFRCIRFPGLISAHTLPSGGTSDYAPEMFHAGAKGIAYDCFVERTSTLPFLMMPDAVTALMETAVAPRSRLTQSVYNVTAFSMSAAELERIAREAFPALEVGYAVHQGRNRIVQSWPAAIDDAPFRRDVGWKPEYSGPAAWNDYLVPALKKRYREERRNVR